MSVWRTFLPWDRPCLPQACDWLLAQAGMTAAAPVERPALQAEADASEIDLSQWVIVLSTARAGRRLLELLVASTVGRAMVPPRIITLRQLPDHLASLASPKPASPVSDLTGWMLRAQAIEQLPLQQLKILMPQPPAKNDTLGRLLLARDLQAIDDELLTSMLSFQQVADHAKQSDSYDDHLRWQVLADLQARYENMLAAQQLCDRRMLRQTLTTTRSVDADDADDDAQAQSVHGVSGRLVLVAVPELSAEAAAILTRLPLRADVLVHAPSSEAEHFDELGRLDVAHWSQRSISLDQHQVHMVQGPADQTTQAASIISSYQPLPEAQEVVIGLGDQKLASLLAQTLQSAGVPSRHVEGRRMSQSPPAVLLQQVAVLLNHMTVRELATLARCPSVHQWLSTKLGDMLQAVAPADRLPLLGWFDTYIHDRLGQRLTMGHDAQADRPVAQQSSPSDKPGRFELAATVVQAAWDAISMLLPGHHDTPAPLSTWSPIIAQLLQTFFGQRELERYEPDDALLIRAIQLIAQVLDEHASLDEATAHALESVNRFTLAQAIELLLVQLAGQLIPPEAGKPATELIAWRELRLDDAPHVITTSFNEGHIPAHQNHHWLLPDSLRQQLGLSDNRSAYAHDAYALTAISHSSRTLDVILQRYDAAGDPLVPSRLLLMGDHDDRCQRIESFYSQSAHAPARPLFLVPGSRSEFKIPRPMPLEKPITSLRVTAFADYLACPYRFYLKHVLGLRTLDDRATEMDALGFGNLAHDILHTFGCSELAHAYDPADMEAFLTDQLERRIIGRFGSSPPAVIRIQQEMLRQRLARMAHWQAMENSLGWRIDQSLIERDVSVTMMVDDTPFEIHGRIDRCDHHDTHGHRLLDYKTGESGMTPDKVHLKNDQWQNLQLPLYDVLGRQGLGLQGEVGLGYVLLPNNLKKVGLSLASWDEAQLAGAIEVAQNVIRDIRQEKFFPPSSDIRADEFSDLCMENVLAAEPQRATEGVS